MRRILDRETRSSRAGVSGIAAALVIVLCGYGLLEAGVRAIGQPPWLIDPQTAAERIIALPQGMPPLAYTNAAYATIPLFWTGTALLLTGVVVVAGGEGGPNAFCRVPWGGPNAADASRMRDDRRLAQLVEHHLHTVGVTGSSPVAPTNTTHTPLRFRRLSRRSVLVHDIRVPEKVFDGSESGPNAST